MPISIEAFLRSQGFQRHPFATTSAEEEGDLLPAFFMRVDWFDLLVGDPAHPQSVVLFAPRGFGKSSHRIELARQVGGRVAAPALVVTLDDLTPLLRNGIEHVTLDAYITLISRLTLECLDDELAEGSPRRRLFAANERADALFQALLYHHAPLRAAGRPIAPAVEALRSALQAANLTPRESLRQLAQLAKEAGYASVYCMVDGVDELHETSRQPEAIWHVLAPLLEAPGLLQGCGFAFKIFLPLALAPMMRQQGLGRLDRIAHYELDWRPDQLRAILGQRLITFSRLGSTNTYSRVRSFADLCDVGYDVDGLLVASSERSPRRLLQLARQIIEEHLARAQRADDLIGDEAIGAVLQPLQPPAADSTERDGQSAPPSPQCVGKEAPAKLDPPVIPPLYMDERGDIWLGSELFGGSLPGLMRKCFDYLWRERHRRVTYAELIETLYGSSAEQRADPEESIDKLVGRLRERLEPNQPTSQNYIQKIARSGYVLRNFTPSRS